ncbi:hypothetical protein LTS18_001378 [Coniosporium uncinatum]|uniref:Uncharacterized protein n=1 Tax=Coniosporium uncinatum TaxID=93489 RepID=A0ACC3D803_9PEZI|nr:hypothetical protein LTS18_001378 [Coniosporium uncinatum]
MHHQFSLLQWTPLSAYQAMGKTCSNSRFNLPGRYAWCAAEILGPLNLLYIFYTLPPKLGLPVSSTSVLGTRLPIQHELIGLLYVLHYVNRAIVTPLFLAPSMSPIHPFVTLCMSSFQLINSSNIACWAVYASSSSAASPATQISRYGEPNYALAMCGVVVFAAGLATNVLAENQLFALRRGAARRKARSEGKARVTFDKVYVIPPAEGLFTYVLYPHYVAEWVEWTGFWLYGFAVGMGGGWESPAAWFVVNEVCTMLPRAVQGRKWYEGRFGKRAVGGRGGGLPVSWL